MYFHRSSGYELSTLLQGHVANGAGKYQDGQILMATQDVSRKIRNIKRNNNVTVLIDTTEVPFKGALIYGTAELDYESVELRRKRAAIRPVADRRPPPGRGTLAVEIPRERSAPRNRHRPTA